jgi:hypothetical protein
MGNTLLQPNGALFCELALRAPYFTFRHLTCVCYLEKAFCLDVANHGAASNVESHSDAPFLELYAETTTR